MTIHDWINANAKIKAVINWQQESGQMLNYKDWTAQMKQDLKKTYDIIAQYQWFMVTDPPPNQLELNDDDWPSTVLAKANAWDIYIAHVAQSLAVEVKNWVKWSVLYYDNADLAKLFDSRAFFLWQYGEYKIDYWTSGNALLGTPSLPWTLMKHGNLIADTPDETIGNLLGWCREHLVHYGGFGGDLKDYYTLNNESYWHYREYVPTSRVILSTKREIEREELNLHIKETKNKHWTAGCHGTNGFLRNVLRTVNIPVIYIRYAGHALPYFPSVEKHLSHGDDPYNRGVKSAGYPMTYLLQDDTDYDAVYTHQDDKNKQNNVLVGYHRQRLTIKYLPLTLLHRRISEGYQSEARNQVYSSFVNAKGKSYYTIEDLEAEELWERLDGKIEAYGGPSKVPAEDEEDYLWDTWKKVLQLKKLTDRAQIQRQAQRNFAKVRPKRKDFSNIQRANPTLNSNITQLVQSSQAPTKKSRISRPRIEEPKPPKQKPIRRKRTTRITKPAKKPLDKKKKPIKKPPAKKKKPIPDEDKETKSDKKKKRSLRKRITKRLKRVVRRG